MSSYSVSLYDFLKTHSGGFHKIVDFDTRNDLVHFDFSHKNAELQQVDTTDTEKFSLYITDKLKTAKARFGIGGYNENRSFYKRSKLFEVESQKAVAEDGDIGNAASRTLHLGIDIWGNEGTKIYAPLGGMVHSFAFNNNFGDYGATIILSHQLDGISFYTLYGHLSLKDITSLKEGYYLTRGKHFAHFGNAMENGHWPPHLHFQIIEDIGINKGDYPGVCNYTERKYYLKNSPDPDVILNMKGFIAL